MPLTLRTATPDRDRRFALLYGRFAGSPPSFSLAEVSHDEEQWDQLSTVVAEGFLPEVRHQDHRQDRAPMPEISEQSGHCAARKWDFYPPPAFDPSSRAAKACGDKLRSEASAKL